jgi:hypothetical protein
MHGTPGLVFCIPAVRCRLFTRVAATARTERAMLALDGRREAGARRAMCSGAAWRAVATGCGSRDRCGDAARRVIDGETREDTEIGRLTVILPIRRLSSSLAPSGLALAAAPC